MNRYLKLVNFELSRFFKIYLVLIGITILSQIVAVIMGASKYLSDMNEYTENGYQTKEQFLMDWGPFSMNDITRGFLYTAPIALCIVTLIIYVFFIWYRDWFGKNTFVYRLLMLPTARINVFYAKATAIFLMVLGLVALQLILIPIESSVLKMMIPADFRMDLTVNQVIYSFDYNGVLFPASIIEFMINYGIGFTAVFVVFTAVLFERSFRLKGILLGVLFGGLAILVFISPLLVQSFVLKQFFYPIELFILTVITGVIVIAGSIWTSNFLLKKKIRV